MRSQFDKQLEALDEKMVELSSLTEQAIEKSFTALETHDLELAQSVIDNDIIINSKETEIETLCLNLLLQQQPVAGDFRTITAILKSITDIERIGDYAVNISETAKHLVNSGSFISLKTLSKMALLSKQMVADSIDAYLSRDLEKANKVITQDDQIDQLMIETRENLVDLIHSAKENGEEAMELYLVARFFERIGDHATNIAEWVEFMITGVHDPE